jgi:hypothetical protein
LAANEINERKITGRNEICVLDNQPDCKIKSGQKITMETLGWIIWGFVCLMLLASVVRLRKERGRKRRLFSCIYTAAALALTYSSFSKFHLLWVIPLRLILGLLLFGLFAGGAFTYYKLTRRKPKKTNIELPPFGPLTWGKCDGWEGKVRLPAWAGFQSRGGAYGSKDSSQPSDGSAGLTINPAKDAAELTPTEAQCRAMQFQIERGGEVVQSVLNALLPYYAQLKKNWELDDKLMPAVSNHEAFRKMMGLSQVHVLPHTTDGLAHVGLEFGCNWDDEHGFGVIVHGASVIKVGQADTAFNWQPEPQSDEKGKT